MKISPLRPSVLSGICRDLSLLVWEAVPPVRCLIYTHMSACCILMNTITNTSGAC